MEALRKRQFIKSRGKIWPCSVGAGVGSGAQRPATISTALEANTNKNTAESFRRSCARMYVKFKPRQRVLASLYSTRQT